MVKDEAMLIVLIMVVLDFANSLYLSQSSVTTEPGKSLAISCRDKGGQPVMWKGPKGTLNANTNPKIQDTSIGKLLVFTPTRVQDTGNYTCSVMNNKNDYSIFSLTVEESYYEPGFPDILDSDYDNSYEIETGIETDIEPDLETTSPSPIPPKKNHHENHENHHPTPNKNKHKPHRNKHRHETTTPDTDTTENSETDHSTIHPHSGQTHKYDVTEEPMEFKDTPEIQRGREGENVTLRCEVNRPYKINWLLDDHKDNLGTKYIVIGDGLLIINVSREDNRKFICQAVKPSTGQVLHKKIRFIVEHKPVPVTIPRDPESPNTPPVYAQDDEVYGFIGENVNLTCEVEAEPPPQFEWKNIKEGQNNIGRVVKVSNHKSVLQLKMTKDTPDTYQCTASNKYGKLKKFINLQIGTRPSPPGKIELVKADAHSLELKVELPENLGNASNKMEPKWLTIFSRIEATDDWDERDFNITLDTFLLTELNSSTKYEIVSATKNVAGLSPLSNFTYFETTAGSVQINNPTIFSLVLIYTLISSATSILA